MAKLSTDLGLLPWTRDILVSDILIMCIHCFLFQALYFCVPFRDQLLEYYASNKSTGDVEENMLTCLADLFSQVLLQLSVVALFHPQPSFKCRSM